MIGKKSSQKPDEGAGFWLVKVLLGLSIVVILVIHLIVNHFVGEGVLLNWQNVVDYFANPWIVFMEITFLVIVVSHSLIGMRSIIMDLNPSRGMMKVVDGVLTIIGFVSIVYGVWLALKIASFSA